MAEKILIIDDDLDTLKLVGMMLQKQGFGIVAATSGAQGLIQAESETPDLILLDVMMPEMDGYEVSKRLRANPYTTGIPILMFTAKTQLDDKVAGFESGADDYLTKPTHPSELVAHVRALLARSAKGKVVTQTGGLGDKRAFAIGVLAARGGLGVTTVAVNLGNAIQSAGEGDVIVAELRPGQGTLALDLGEENPSALSRLLRINQPDLTRQKVREELFIHPTGLRILFGTSQPKDAALLEASVQFETLLHRLIFLAPYLVLDLGAGLTSLTQKMVKSCNQLLIVVEPVPNSVVHTKAMFNDLIELGFNKKNIHAIVVNRIRSDMQMSWVAVQDKLEHSIPVTITPNPELFYQASRLRTTAYACQPTGLIAQQFDKLATILIDLSKLPGVA